MSSAARLVRLAMLLFRGCRRPIHFIQSVSRAGRGSSTSARSAVADSGLGSSFARQRAVVGDVLESASARRNRGRGPPTSVRRWTTRGRGRALLAARRAIFCTRRCTPCSPAPSRTCPRTSAQPIVSAHAAGSRRARPPPSPWPTTISPPRHAGSRWERRGAGSEEPWSVPCDRVYGAGPRSMLVARNIGYPTRCTHANYSRQLAPSSAHGGGATRSRIAQLDEIPLELLNRSSPRYASGRGAAGGARRGAWT